MAAQDFRHASQEEMEKTGDFIRHLERLFKVAFGHDNLSVETRNAFLYGQLQEGLRYRLMEAPDVSGAPDYQALCLAAKAEEKCLAELTKRRQYIRELRRNHSTSSDSTLQPFEGKKTDGDTKTTRGWGAGGGGGQGVKQKATGRCWTCDKPGHKASECKSKPRGGGNNQPPRTNQVQTSEGKDEQPGAGTTTDTTQSTDPLRYLLPDSDEEGVIRVAEVRMKAKGSRPQLVRVEISGVPLDGVVDTGADITIVGAEAFKRIATVAKLHRRDFKQPDKTPRTHDQKTFHIDGRVDLDITFQECTMKTPVYVKMDAKEQLLLSEGVCRQLGIVTYHGAVSPGQGEAEGVAGDGAGGEVYVPTVQVTLVQTVKLKPGGEAVVGVRLVSCDGGLSLKSVDQDGDGLPPMLLESDQQLQDTTGVKMSSSLVQPTADGFARVLLTNQLTLTHRLMEGTEIGYATLVEVMETYSSENADQARVRTVTSDGTEDQARRKELITLLSPELRAVPEEERTRLEMLLRKYHNVFSLEDGERGETDMT